MKWRVCALSIYMNQPGEEWDEDVRKPRNRVGGELNKIHSPTRVERKKFFEYCAEYWTAHLDDQTVVSNESLLGKVLLLYNTKNNLFSQCFWTMWKAPRSYDAIPTS